jgi:DNA-directed RNA polymerase subunit RPC12/RpoP
MKCTACGGALEDGFIPDTGHAQTWVAVWLKGAPAANTGFFNRLRTGGGVDMTDVDAKAIDARRCTDCGHLELFATRSPDPGTTLAR